MTKSPGKKFEEDFDSQEEYQFYEWLKEAEDNNLVSGIVYQPPSIELSERASVQYVKQLKTKTKVCDKFLFHPHSYTPDFYFELTTDALDNVFVNPHLTGKVGVVVDVKGTFNKYGDPKQFSINQKWIYQKYGIYVHKIIPVKLFKKTWCPEVARLTPKRKDPVKKYIDVPVIRQFIEGLK